MVAVEGREAPLYVLMLLILCIQTSVIFIYFFYNTNIECRYLGRNKEDLADEVCVGEKLLCL